MHKSKNHAKKLVTSMLIAILLISSIPISVSAQNTVTVSPECEFQTFKGWGTSLSWWGNAIGGWQNKTKQDEILDLLYDQNTGLGLTVARYNIGGGDDPTHTHMRNGACLEGYQPSPGVWDYDADETQRYILNEAMSRGVNIVEGFSKTPPYWMTYSSCAGGNVNGTSNLKPEYYNDYADYLAEVYLLFKNTYGITFDSISPINEPNGPWWEVNNRQEGCHYEHNEQNDLFKVLSDTFDKKGLSNVTIAGPEGFEYDATISSWNSYDNGAKSSIDKINSHSYYGSERLYLNTIALCNNKRLSISEYGVGVGEHDHNAIESSLELARKIRNDVHDTQVETWVYWQAVEEEFDVNNWGFIHANFEGEEDYAITKQYYGMANFSKFIRPDSTIIGADSSDMLVALNKNTNKLTIVVINDKTSQNNYTIDLSKFAAVGGSASAYRTSSTENLAQLSAISIQDKTLQISYKGGTVPVISAVTTRYLLDLLLQYREMNIYEYLKLSYGEGKIRTDYLDAGMESVLALQKAEIEDLQEALDRFETEPWTEILKDNFYCYKSYKPSTNKKNYFIHTEFADKQIAKFRCGKHSQIRCFGYREKEYFYILSIERDHSLSDTG